MRVSPKQRQLILAFYGRAETPEYRFGGLAPAIARLRKLRIVGDRHLTPFGAAVAVAILNKSPLPDYESFVKGAIERAARMEAR